MKKKSVGGAVLGIIAAVFAILGGFMLALCAAIADVATLGAANLSWVAWVFGIGGAVVALVGAILDFSKPLIGGILEAVSLIMIIVAQVLIKWQWAMIVAMILLVVGTILSFCVQKEVK